MKTVLILRHAKSSWKDRSLGDHERPLNKRGKGDAPRMGRLIAEKGIVPQCVLSSTAARALKTAEAAASEWEESVPVQACPEMYMGGSDAYIEAIEGLSNDIECVMTVGHYPDVENFLKILTGADEDFPTAALAQVEVPIDEWSELSAASPGRLIALWRPKALKEDRYS